MICGDFNTTLENSRILREMVVASGLWCDGASLFGTVAETPIEPTYTAFGASSRIDMILLNVAATRALTKCQVVPVCERGTKRHMPVQCEIGLESRREFAGQIPHFRKFPKGHMSLGQEEANHLENFVVQEFNDEFVRAREEKCVESKWNAWCRMAENFLPTKASQETGSDQNLKDGRCFERGVNVEPLRVRVGRAPEPKGGV